MNISHNQGSITQTPADALMTLINSGGPHSWNGGVDRAIRSLLITSSPHNDLWSKRPLIEGDAHLIPIVGAPFNNVLFIIDDLSLSIEELLKSGLIVAQHSGIKRISAPAFRCGVMLGATGLSLTNTVREQVQVVANFMKEQDQIVSFEWVIYPQDRNYTELMANFEYWLSTVR